MDAFEEEESHILLGIFAKLEKRTVFEFLRTSVCWLCCYGNEISYWSCETFCYHSIGYRLATP